MESPHAPPMDDQGGQLPDAAGQMDGRPSRQQPPRATQEAAQGAAGKRLESTDRPTISRNENRSIRVEGAPSKNPPQTRKGPQGGIPCGPSSALIEKRPPRARRPALPQPGAAVLSAKAGLTAGFGMGPGDPRLCGRARGGRSPAAHVFEPARYPFTGATLAAAWRARIEDDASRSVLIIEDAKSSGY